MKYMILMLLTQFSFGLYPELGDISGTVIDHKDQTAMPGVHIELFQDKQLIDETFSTVDGKFTLSGVPAGYYDITFKFVGKKKKKIKGIIVAPGQTSSLEVTYPQMKKTRKQ